ncbi:MAG: hypothetical protein ABIP65_07235 [Vicinamibacterales bacterium]
MSNTPVNCEGSPDRIGASFEERSVWVQLLGLTMVLGGYFFVAWQMLSQGVIVLAAYAAVFAVSVGMMVVVLVAGHTAVAIASRPNGRDERDRLIQWRAESNSGWLLATGVLAGITCMVLSLPNVWTAHLLLASLFVAEMLKLVLQLVYYRRGM